MATLHSNTCPICGRTFEWEGDTPPDSCPFCFASISIETENTATTDMDDIADESIREETVVPDTLQEDSADDTEQFIREMLGGFSHDSEEDLLAKIKQEILSETQAQAADEDAEDSETIDDSSLEETSLEKVTILEAVNTAVQNAEDTVDQPSAMEQENISFAEDVEIASEGDVSISVEEPANTDGEEIQETIAAEVTISEEVIEEPPSSKHAQAKEDTIEEIPSAIESQDADIDAHRENKTPNDGEDILDIASIEEFIAEESAIQDSADSDVTEIDIFEALAQEAMQKDMTATDLPVESEPSFEGEDAVSSVEDTAQPDIHNLAAAMQAEGEPVRRRVVRRNMNEHMPAAEETSRTPVRKRAPAEAAEARKQKRVHAQKKRGALKYYIIAAAVLVVVVLAGYFGFLKPMGHYNKGAAYAAEGENLLALTEFTKAGGYSDAKTKVKDILAPFRGQAIALEDHFAAEGKYAAVQNNLGQVYYANFETHTDPTVAQGDVASFVIYKGFVVAVRANGGVAFSNLTTTDNPVPDLQGWETVQSVQVLSSTLVGTKEDGSYITSDNIDISRLTAEDILTVNDIHGMFGVKKDGTVSVPNALEISTKKEAETLVDTVGKWKDIALVEGTSTTRIVGLTSTGRVKVAPAISKDTSGADKTAGWRNIVDVASGQYHTVGLKADGTVVATGNNDYGQCNVSEWTDIIAIEAGNLFTIGIKKDGTVLVTSKTGSYIPVNFVDGYIPEPIIFADAEPDDIDPNAASSEPADNTADTDGTDGTGADGDGTDTTDPNASGTGDGTDAPTDSAPPSPNTDAGE